MKTLNISDIFTLEQLQSRIPERYRNSVDLFSSGKASPLIYTSFDGDYMLYLSDMQKYVYTKGGIPVNPEAALGYYVSTSTYKGKKVPVMMDCIRTELMCDEMWVFNPISGHIPEGVIAEMIIWDKIKSKSFKSITFFHDELSPINYSREFDEKNWHHKDVIKYLEQSRTVAELSEINEKLLIPYSKKSILNSYLIVNFRNYKHIDWARKFCYEREFSPVSPLNILPFHMYETAKLGMHRYIQDRLTLLTKADSVFLFSNLRKTKEELDSLDIFSLCELYYLSKKVPNIKIQVIDWQETGVPKYSNNPEWALTTIEKAEV